MKKKRVQEWVAVMVVLLFSIAVGGYSLSIGNIDLHVPIADMGDQYLGMMLFKSIDENGIRGVFTNPRLGAPEVSALVDTPFLDGQYVLIVRILTAFLDYTQAFYLFYLLTFVTAAVAMYLFLGTVTKSKIVQVLLACAYAITPYHFFRGMQHLTLTNCFMVPIALYIAMTILGEEYQKGFPVRDREKEVRKLKYALCVILIGFGNIYYILFSIILMGLALCGKMIRTKSWKPLKNEAISLYAVLFCMLLSMLPKVMYANENGINYFAAVRNPSETELYGLNIFELLLPPAYTRVKALATFAVSYLSQGLLINENYYAAMGLIACVGFFALCVHFIYSMFQGQQSDEKSIMQLKFLELCLIAMILYCISSGFGTMFSYLVMPEFRALNRVSIFLVAICLTGLAIFLEKIQKTKGKRICIALLAVCFLYSLYAEIPKSSPKWQDDLKTLDSVRRPFFAKMEEMMDEGDMIYQLPHVDFPEAPAYGDMNSYTSFTGYLYTDHLRWSFGGMKGRNYVARLLYVDDGCSEAFLDGIKKTGFAGLYIDGYGYEDGGTEIVAYYTNLLQQEPLQSADGRFFFFDIRSY